MTFCNMRLARTRHPVEVALHGTQLARGSVYVAPDDVHLGVTADQRIELSAEAPIGRQRPAGDYLLRCSRATSARAPGLSHWNGRRRR